MGHDPNFAQSRAMQLLQRAVERWGEKVPITQIGPSTGLAALPSLRTQYQLLFDVLESPEEIIRPTNLFDYILSHEHYLLLQVVHGHLRSFNLPASS